MNIKNSVAEPCGTPCYILLCRLFPYNIHVITVIGLKDNQQTIEELYHVYHSEPWLIVSNAFLKSIKIPSVIFPFIQWRY